MDYALFTVVGDALTINGPLRFNSSTLTSSSIILNTTTISSITLKQKGTYSIYCSITISSGQIAVYINSAVISYTIVGKTGIVAQPLVANPLNIEPDLFSQLIISTIIETTGDDSILTIVNVGGAILQIHPSIGGVSSSVDSMYIIRIK
jgi:hypothetical protein